MKLCIIKESYITHSYCLILHIEHWPTRNKFLAESDSTIGEGAVPQVCPMYSPLLYWAVRFPIQVVMRITSLSLTVNTTFKSVKVLQTLKS